MISILVTRTAQSTQRISAQEVMIKRHGYNLEELNLDIPTYVFEYQLQKFLQLELTIPRIMSFMSLDKVRIATLRVKVIKALLTHPLPITMPLMKQRKIILITRLKFYRSSSRLERTSNKISQICFRV